MPREDVLRPDEGGSSVNRRPGHGNRLVPLLARVVSLAWCLMLCATCIASAAEADRAPAATWWDTPGYVAHALGGLEHTSTAGTPTITNYTNSLEAFEQSYAKGHRVFEVDLILTSDGALVARHDWGARMYARLGQEPRATVPSHAEFLSTPILGSYTPLDIHGVVRLMRKYPDIYVVTDTRYKDTARVRKQFRAIVAAMGSKRLSLGKRIIVQVYDEKMFRTVRSIYPFRQVIYSLYQQEWTASLPYRAARFARANRIRVVALPASRWSPAVTSRLRAAGVATAVHTVNSPEVASQLRASGVRLIYTDQLAP